MYFLCPNKKSAGWVPCTYFFDLFPTIQLTCTYFFDLFRTNLNKLLIQLHLSKFVLRGVARGVANTFDVKTVIHRASISKWGVAKTNQSFNFTPCTFFIDLFLTKALGCTYLFGLFPTLPLACTFFIGTEEVTYKGFWPRLQCHSD